MIRVSWSARSREDFKELTRWLAAQDVRAARFMQHDLIAVVAKLAGHHDLGRPGVVSGTREKSWPKWSKVIVYTRTDTDLIVVSIRDTRMQRQGGAVDESGA